MAPERRLRHYFRDAEGDLVRLRSIHELDTLLLVITSRAIESSSHTGRTCLWTIACSICLCKRSPPAVPGSPSPWETRWRPSGLRFLRSQLARRAPSRLKVLPEMAPPCSNGTGPRAACAAWGETADRRTAKKPTRFRGSRRHPGLRDRARPANRIDSTPETTNNRSALGAFPPRRSSNIATRRILHGRT